MDEKKGHGLDRNPLISFGAGGRDRTVDLLIMNQMGMHDNYLILKDMFSTACRLPAVYPLVFEAVRSTLTPR